MKERQRLLPMQKTTPLPKDVQPPQDIKIKLNIDVNENPSKKGIKVQIELPHGVVGDEKTEIMQKLQARLNRGLSKYNLTANIDPDVPYDNVLGFLITIQSIRSLIKNIMLGKDKDVPKKRNS